MNLLFIDCEVANKHNIQPKIAQFGYVLVNDSFQIIEEGNFFINPGENEDFSDVVERKIELAHFENDYEFYRKQNKFPYYYEKIKSLLTNPENQVIGWDIKNDLFCISSECKRYELIDINIKAFDVQTFYRITKKKLVIPSLSNAINNLFPNNDDVIKIKEHYSKTNALLAFKVFEKICNEYRFTLSECLSKDIFSSWCYTTSSNSFKKEYVKLKSKQVKENIFNSTNWNNIKRYVFFDTECANCFNDEGKICEFGWTIVTSNFQKQMRGEYIINPGNGKNYNFALIGRKNQKDLHLRYEKNNYEIYRKAPEFDYYIDYINYLFNQNDILIFGFDVKNDFDYLDYSYRRYGNNPLDIFAIDVHILFKQLLKESGGLEAIVKKYLPEDETKNINFHEASYDAMATMIALKYLIEKHFNSKLLLGDLIRQAGLECIITSKWDIEVTKLNADERKLREYISRLKGVIEKPFDKLRRERKSDEKYKTILSDPKFIGKRFSFSNEVQKSDLDCIDLCKRIESQGYILALETKDVDILICKDEDESRLLKEKIKHDVNFIKLDDFLSALRLL